MYSNLFDSVRVETNDLINFEGLLYASILNNMHPSLSLNQAADSKALMNILYNGKSNFLQLFEKGYIRVAVYNSYANKQTAVTSYLSDQLKNYLNSNKPSFHFSSLPFLDDGRYDDSQIRKIIQIMLEFLDRGPSSITPQTANNIGLSSENAFEIENYLQGIIALEKAINGKYLQPGRINNFRTLSDRLKQSVAFYKRETDPSSDFAQALKEFEKIIQNLNQDDKLRALLNSRSYIEHNIIPSLACDAVVEKQLNAVVDWCYNETVAASIVDNENDIMVQSEELKSLLKNSNKPDDENYIDRAKQSLSLVDRAGIYADDKTPFTWELLLDILEGIGKTGNNISWSEKVEKYCQEMAHVKLKLSANKLLIGSLPYAVTAAAAIITNVFSPDLSLIQQVSITLGEKAAADIAASLLSKKSSVN